MIMMIDDIQILFKTKNPWGVNDLLWGVNWGFGGVSTLWGYIGR